MPEYQSKPAENPSIPRTARSLYTLLTELCDPNDFPDEMFQNIALECHSLADVEARLQGRANEVVRFNGSKYGDIYAQRLQSAVDTYRKTTDTRTLVAVGCSGAKIDDEEPVPAKDRYDSGYWDNKRDYGEAIGDQWKVISAEYSLLDPNEPIPYYERTPKELKGVPVQSGQVLPTGARVETALDHWALRVHQKTENWIAVNDLDGDVDIELQILLGRKYEDPLRDRDVFDALSTPSDLTVSFPFREVDGLTGIGRQREWMIEQAEQA